MTNLLCKDLIGIVAQLASDLGNHFPPLNPFQGDFGLEDGVVSLSPADYNALPPLEIRQAQNAL